VPSRNIERCFGILELLSEYGHGLSLSTVVSKSGIPKTAARRMLTSLCDAGYVRHLPSKNYCIGLSLPALGIRFLSGSGVIVECQLVVAQLAEDAGELARMCLVEDGRLRSIASAQGARQNLVVNPLASEQTALHCSAAGKVWLSSLHPEDALKRVHTTLREMHPDCDADTNAMLKTLGADLELTRERGYGLSTKELDPGIASVAVGIISTTSNGTEAVGTLSVEGPICRLPRERLLSLLPKLNAAAARLRGVDTLIRYL
jgi:DNA-binding IclR family transcriptional regulator